MDRLLNSSRLSLWTLKPSAGRHFAPNTGVFSLSLSLSLSLSPLSLSLSQWHVATFFYGVSYVVSSEERLLAMHSELSRAQHAAEHTPS